MNTRLRLSAAFAILVAAGVIFGQATQPSQTDAPAAQKPAGPPVPQKELDDLWDLLSPPKVKIPPAKAAEMHEQQLKQILSRGKQLEQTYSKAPNLAELRLTMINAARTLAVLRPDPGYRDEVEQIAQRVLQSDASAADKVRADASVARLRLVDDRGKRLPTAAKEIEAFVARHAQSAPAHALMAGATLATEAGQNKLAMNYMMELNAKHGDDPEVLRFLRQAGILVDVGRPFNATLTTLDGKQLKLPDSFKGRVVVVDFWATWCGPCVASMPRMVEIYEKYRGRGVEFIGISLDSNPGALRGFLARQPLPWPQTFSGQGWSDPTVSHYGIRGIPSVWVIGKDGKVVAQNVHPTAAPGQKSQLEIALDRALAQVVTQPANNAPQAAPATAAPN